MYLFAHRFGLLVAVSCLLLVGRAQAASLTWDATTATTGADDGAGTWLTANRWWDGLGNVSWNSVTPDDAIIGNGGTGGTITTGTLTAGTLTINAFSGSYTISNTVASTFTLNGGLTMNSGAGNVTLGNGSLAVAIGGAQTWTNNSSSLFTEGGALSLGANQLTVDGTGNLTVSGLISGSGGSIVKNGTGTLTLSLGTSTFTGGTVLTSGTLVIATPSTGGPPPISGPLGTGSLTVNGGTFRWSQGNNTLGNAINIGGSATFDIANGGTSATVTLSGPVTIGSTPTLTFTNSGAGTSSSANYTISGLTTLNSNVTLNINDTVGQDPFVRLSGGIDLNGADRTITVQTSNSTAKGISIAGTLKNTGGSGQNLTINGTNNVTANNPITTGTGNPGIIYSGSATLNMSSFAHTFTGGVTLTSGTLSFDSASTLTTGAITSGPFGSGTLTLNGGLTSLGSTSQIIHNSLVLSGTTTIASTVNPGNTLTFSPTLVTSPAAGTTTVNGATTLRTNHNTLTLNGAITGINSPSLTVQGAGIGASGTVTLVNNSGTASTFGDVNIGQSVASGSLGGTLVVAASSAANQQNSMGSGAYTINYGGTFQSTTTAFNPTNNFTVNNGGTLSLLGPSTPSGTISLSSGARLVNATNPLTFSTNAPLPTAGVLLFGTGSTVSVTDLAPSLTGTMVFGGTLGAAATFSGGSSGNGTILSSATGQNRVIAFNVTNNPSIAYTFGFRLNANLTIVGTGNSSVSGAVPQNVAASLGNIQETGGIRSVTIAMAPTGMVGMGRVDNFTGEFTGGLTITGGTLAVDGGNSIGVKAATSLTLNGGTIRNQNNANNDCTWQDAITVGTSGGMIESFANTNSNFQNVTFSGAITGSAPLTLRYGGNTAGNVSGSAVLLAPSSASAYSGSITVATSNGTGRAQFNANSLNGIATGGVNVGAGLAFGVDQLSTLTNNIGKFSTTTGTIFVLNNVNSSNIDLSAAGLNRDIRIGGDGYRSGITFSGTITPFGSTYNLTPTNSQTVTFGTANQFTDAAGPVSRNLDIRAGEVAPGAYAVATGTLALTAAHNFTGTTTVAGTIKNSLMGTGTTGTTLRIITGGDLTSTSAITLERGANLTLTGSGGKITAAAPLTIRSSATANIGSGTATENNTSTNRLNATTALTLGGSEGGGTFTIMFPAAGGTHSQTLASLAVAAGSNTISTGNGAAGTLNLAFTGTAGGAGYTRVSGGFVNFAAAAGYAPSFTNAPTSLAGSSVSGGASGNDPILVGALYNSDLVKAAAGTLAAPTWTTADNPNTWTGGQNVQSATTTTTYAVSNDVSANAIKSNNTVANDWVMNVAATKTMTIDSGMILHTGTGRFLTIGGAGAITTSGSRDLELINLNASGGDLTISAQITGNIPLTVRSSGGNVKISNSSNQITDVNALAGTINFNAAGALAPASVRTLNLLGGTVQFSTAGGNFTNTSINVGTAGGNINVNAGSPVSFGGNVTLNGAMTLSAPSGGGSTTTTFSGNISGPGMILIGKQSDGKNVTLITGDNGGWTGGVRFDVGNNAASGNSYLRFSPAVAGFNSAGTGPIFLTAGNTPGGIFFDTTNAGSTTFSNDIINNLIISNNPTRTPLVAWGLSSGLGTGAANTTTLSGKLVGSQGLLLQGYATGDNAISEMVLSGTVSVSGDSGGYSYGNSSSAQNFNNGQGGITLGVTQYRTTTLQGTGNVPLADLPSGQAVNGAEGFVRFSGVNSFIPGAVGPGFIAAIRKAGAGQDGRFGYLLTGTAGGTTYTLPQGKSFLIGSLGTGTQQYGTLGASGTGTATLEGGIKHNAPTGELLAGFNGGDVNIHANAAADNQQLNLLARESGTNFVLGTVANPVVMTPTYGDSGYTSAITLLSKRTGTNTLNKIGAGTVEVKNVSFAHTDGADARGTFTWNVNAGTLRYNQVDTGANYAGFNVANGATLAGSGTILGTVTAASGAILAPGNSAGTLTLGGLSTTDANYNFELGAVAGSDKIDLGLTGILSASGTNTFSFTDIGSFGIGTYTLIDYGSIGSGGIGNFALASSTLSGYSLTLQDSGSAIVLSVTGGAVTGVWSNGSGDHLWTTGSNWSGGLPANPGDIAQFTNAGLGATTNPVNLSGDKTIGKLQLSTTSGGYTIGISATTFKLTLNNLSGNATLEAQSGTHTVNAKIVTAGTNLDISTTGAASLTLAQGIDNTAGKAITLNNTAGTLNVGNITTVTASTLAVTGSATAGNLEGASGAVAGSTTLNANATLTANRVRQDNLTISGSSGNAGAKLTINASPSSSPTNAGDPDMVSRVNTLSISGTTTAFSPPNPLTGYGGSQRTYYGTLDLKNNDLIVNNVSPQDNSLANSQLSLITDYLRSGASSTGTLAAPDWAGKGINTSYGLANSALGVIRNVMDPGAAWDSNNLNPTYNPARFSAWGDQTLAGNEILVKHTWYGDFDLDGKVSSFDFALLDAGFAGAKQFDTTVGWFFGDANYNGIIDSQDYTLAVNGYTAYTGGGNVTLPEPSSLLLVSLSVVGLLAAGRRRRQLAHASHRTT